MRLHCDVDPTSGCRGQVADGSDLFRTDYWCVYCGTKWSEQAIPLFVWSVEGDPRSGTLQVYANDCEQCHYAGLQLGPIFVLVDGRPEEIELERGSYESNDYLVVDLRHGRAEARYSIDLRA